MAKVLETDDIAKEERVGERIRRLGKMPGESPD